MVVRESLLSDNVGKVCPHEMCDEVDILEFTVRGSRCEDIEETNNLGGYGEGGGGRGRRERGRRERGRRKVGGKGGKVATAASRDITLH